MSINFNDDLDQERQDAIQKILGVGNIVAKDKKTILSNLREFDRRLMTEVANAAKQPARVDLHGVGEIKTLSDGTRYEVTANGWKKL